ncbi:MAG: ABC transporter substrate-binding protein [Chloroflexi bacterium]|nr:ABC transporter substrate-binding protein [Chloroflexota bacterium]
MEGAGRFFGPSMVWVVVAGVVFASCAPVSTPTPVPPTIAPRPTPPSAAPTTMPPSVAPAATPVIPAPTTPTPTGERPRYGGILTAYESSEAATLDPNQESTIFALQNAAGVFNTLVEVDPQRLPDRVLIGDLAEKWSVSQDAKTWTFTLKNGVTFHDGRTLTSADVAFTIERIKRAPDRIKSPLKELFLAVEKAEPSDAQTVRIVLNRPVPYFLALMAQPTTSITPKHILEAGQHAIEQKPLGSGPFMFKAWNKNVSIELVRNPNYFKKGLPYLDGTRWVTLREPATQLAALRTGRVVFAGFGTRGLTKREADLLERDIPGVQISRYRTVSVEYVLTNTRKKPLDDIRVRKAIFNAMSQPDVVTTAYQGAGFTGAYLPPGEWALPESDLKKMPPYRGATQAELGEAKKLLAEAGYPNGLTLEFLQPHLYEAATLVVAASLRKVGIETKVRVVQYPVEWVPLASQGNFQITIAPATNALYDPDAFLNNNLSGDSQNYQGLADPEIDGLYNKQRAVVDFAERKRIVDQLQLALWERRTHFPTFYVMYHHAALPVVRNWKGAGVLRDNFKYETLWLAE